MTRRPQMSAADFERLVEETLEGLPEPFLGMLENIAIVVEEEPSPEDFEESESDDEDSELLGIFRGVPRTEKTFDSPVVLPDQVAIFRGPILRVTASRSEAAQEIRETVIHELGHYFGLSDEEMPY